LSTPRGIGPVKIEVLLLLLDRAVHSEALVQTFPCAGRLSESIAQEGQLVGSR